MYEIPVWLRPSWPETSATREVTSRTLKILRAVTVPGRTMMLCRCDGDSTGDDDGDGRNKGLEGTVLLMVLHDIARCADGGTEHGRLNAQHSGRGKNVGRDPADSGQRETVTFPDGQPGSGILLRTAIFRWCRFR
jgi:hypothetical protein